MTSSLHDFREKLYELFAQLPYREAHQKAAEHLRPLAGDQDFFEELILESAGEKTFFLQKRINPVIAFNLANSNDCNIIAHCWIPRPDGNTDVTHQSIHHHGNLLLTSLSAFGPGYESVLFRPGFETDKNSLQTKMKVEKLYRNPQGNIELVETYTPHVVFYPEKLSVTYALWSKDQRTVSKNLRNNPLLQKYKAVIKPILYSLGIDKALQVNTIKFFDFYVDNGQVIVMPDRVRYPEGSNENFLRAFFHLLQSIQFKNISKLEKIIRERPDAKAAIPFLENLKAEKPIENVFEPSHLMIPKVTLDRSAIYRCFPELARSGSNA